MRSARSAMAQSGHRCAAQTDRLCTRARPQTRQLRTESAEQTPTLHVSSLHCKSGRRSAPTLTGHGEHASICSAPRWPGSGEHVGMIPSVYTRLQLLRRVLLPKSTSLRHVTWLTDSCYRLVLACYPGLHTGGATTMFSLLSYFGPAPAVNRNP